MRILVLEDEPYVAEYIIEKCQSILGGRVQAIHNEKSLDPALQYITHHAIDLLLLDLNLNGESGYDILKEMISQSFHTIIISAHTEQAIEAFQYGVLDFIPKPFTERRLKLAFDRFFGASIREDVTTKYLSVRVGSKIRLIHINDILFFKASGNYVEAHLNNKSFELLDKKMSRLEQILPANFIRIHRSYIVDISQVTAYLRKPSGAYLVETKDHICLPLGKKRLKYFKDIFVSDNM
jgi:DNA-binding LytR/AlgR family response regulator